ncbi:PREDICTED: proline-, glutamic acid- and leucine-rich protein 1-like [Chrysochloris asiatica]|uniref:Prothymosin alpha n=1 Tax=Chrysochloris asiatica TaxID=185453 RepID=A0A9B0X019_CHRAS|nr:PREDICTED: proline-, glutamic acid- and leucine-rich protein 1-like [Chrysochloris asiatica]
MRDNVWEWLLRVWINGARNTKLGQSEFIYVGPLTKCIYLLCHLGTPNKANEGTIDCKTHDLISPLAALKNHLCIVPGWVRLSAPRLSAPSSHLRRAPSSPPLWTPPAPLSPESANSRTLCHPLYRITSVPHHVRRGWAVDTSSKITTKDLKEKKEVVKETENGRDAPANGNANEENGEQEADNEVDEEEEEGGEEEEEEEEGDGEEEDGDEDEEAEAATGKRAAEDDEDDDVDTKKQKTDEDD